MRLNYELTLAAGVLVAAACGGGDDKTPGAQDTNASSASGNQDAGSVSSSSPSGSPSGSSGGSCGKGAYSFSASTLQLCGAGADDGKCDPISKAKGYTKYNGDVEIFPGTDDDLSDLSCLSEIGMLTISDGMELTSLKGLGGVSSANGVAVVGMKKLTSLAGLDKLANKSIVELTINGNAALTDIVGLPTGLSVESVYIQGNQELTSLAGLKGLKVTTSIAIENNPKLSSCVAAAFAAGYPSVQFSNFGNKTETCP